MHEQHHTPEPDQPADRRPLRLLQRPSPCVLCGWAIYDEARELPLGVAHVECAADRSGGVMRGGR